MQSNLSSLPEITLKAIILSGILVVVLAASNAYLGLKIGITISASIPAAVISMGVLRLFKRSNILENNIVQTAASAGEAIVAGIIYVLPAMLIIHYWEHFNYWETFWISLIGGILGVFFTIPLRRILLSHKELRFPEGTAIGEVLKASASKKGDLKHLLRGGCIGGIISFCQGGLQIFSTSMQFWQQASHRFVYGFNIGFDPALMAAGYIVGPGVAISTLLGVFLGWIIGIPVLTAHLGVATTDPAAVAMDAWQNHIRYIGVGTMLVGGFWTLLTLMKPIADGLRTSFNSVKTFRQNNHQIPKTEQDIPIHYVIWSILVLCIPLGFLIYHYIPTADVPSGIMLPIITVAIFMVFVIIAGFLFSALGGYFAGLVGSTNSPSSALSIAAILLISLIMLALWGTSIHFGQNISQTLTAIALTIAITSLLGAAGITNETIQDLKAGQMVGSTPWKQQVMLILGVIISAFLMPWILELLYQAYGMGGVFPHPGMDPARMLAAPQAGMMAALAQGAFNAHLPWPMLSIGAVIAVVVIALNYHLRKKGHDLAVLAVGFGIYLPLDATLPFIMGGIAAYFINKSLQQKQASHDSEIKEGKHRGITLACGIVAGAALVGVLLAIPFAIKQSTDVLKIASDHFMPFANALSVLVTLALLGWFYYTVQCAQSDKSERVH